MNDNQENTKKTVKRNPLDLLTIDYTQTFDRNNETDAEIITAIERWQQTFERHGFDLSDLIYAFIHNSASDTMDFPNYAYGFLMKQEDPNWNYNPWTGESINDPEE